MDRSFSPNGGEPLVRVNDLVKHYSVGSLFAPRVLKAVDGVSFDIARGETLGLVGESGCGKSTVARCLVRLVPATSGTIYFDDVPVHDLSRPAMQRLRRRMQIVFQDPRASLNPRMLIRSTLTEPLRLHLKLSGKKLEERLRELMHQVGLETTHLERYPHQLSGGQCQRVGIARAIATNPDFIVLDEPTSSLDVSVQNQILLLLQKLQTELHLSYLFISHNLGVIKHVCRRMAVMYLGRIVEIGSTTEIFSNPSHPYTRALLSTVPSATFGVKRERVRLPGEVPSPIAIPLGCRLAPRCPLAQEPCTRLDPEMLPLGGTHHVACFAATGWPTTVPGLSEKTREEGHPCTD